METDDRVLIPLRDGRSLVLLPDALVLRDQRRSEVFRIALADITGISRGGSDLIITRREADPVAVTAKTITDAARLLDAVRRQQVAPPRPPWWNRHRPPRRDS